MKWYVQAFQLYTAFKGRDRRTEFWMFTLIHWAIIVGLVAVGSLLSSEPPTDTESTILGLLLFVYLAASFVPTLSVTARRLHDVGLSGWLQVVTFIPVLNIIGIPVVLVIAMLPGTTGPNRHGPDPRERTVFRPLVPPAPPGPYGS